MKGVVKARPTGELARMKLPANDLIWLECIRLERRSIALGGGAGLKVVDTLVSKALKECPRSGIHSNRVGVLKKPVFPPGSHRVLRKRNAFEQVRCGLKKY